MTRGAGAPFSSARAVHEVTDCSVLLRSRLDVHQAVRIVSAVDVVTAAVEKHICSVCSVRRNQSTGAFISSAHAIAERRRLCYCTARGLSPHNQFLASGLLNNSLFGRLVRSLLDKVSISSQADTHAASGSSDDTHRLANTGGL